MLQWCSGDANMRPDINTSIWAGTHWRKGRRLTSTPDFEHDARRGGWRDSDVLHAESHTLNPPTTYLKAGQTTITSGEKHARVMWRRPGTSVWMQRARGWKEGSGAGAAQWTLCSPRGGWERFLMWALRQINAEWTSLDLLIVCCILNVSLSLSLSHFF